MALRTDWVAFMDPGTEGPEEGNWPHPATMDAFRMISGCDEYGGEWTSFWVGKKDGSEFPEYPTKEDWEGISQAWEMYCVGTPETGVVYDPENEPMDMDSEWDFVVCSNIGDFFGAQFVSNDRGGKSIFILHS